MERVDEARRVVHAPVERVLSALTDGAARAVWLPPDGMSATVEWFDARPGGGYRRGLEYDDTSLAGKSGCNRDVVEVRFVEVTATRVVEEAEFVAEDPDLAGTMTMTWTVTPMAEGSLVTITARDVPPGIDRGDHLAAFESTLAHLADHVETPVVGGDETPVQE